VIRVADDCDGTLGMVEVDHDFEVAGRRARRLVDDRDLFLLGAALERVAQAQEPGGDDRSRGRASKAVDRSTVRFALGLFRYGLFAVVVDSFWLVPIEVLHTPTVCRISRRKVRAVA